MPNNLILVIDDNANMRLIIREVLRATQMKSIEASDATTAFEHLQNHEFSAILVDISMPMLNGLEFIQLVRASKVRAIRELPILVVSGHGSKAKVQEAIKVGADDFLVKPISAAALLTHLQRAAARRGENADHWSV